MKNEEWRNEVRRPEGKPIIELRFEKQSLAIIRSVSLRLQNEGQKNAHGSHRCTRSLWHGFFWPFLLMQKDYKRICKRDRLRLLKKWRMKKRSSAAEGKANEEWRMKKRSSAAGGKANEELSASPNVVSKLKLSQPQITRQRGKTRWNRENQVSDSPNQTPKS